MLRRFAAATAVASVLIAASSAGANLLTGLEVEGLYVLASIWCGLPFIWGLWAMITPASWYPERLPQWGALLGVLAGTMAVFVLDIPGLLLGASLPGWQGGLIVVVATGAYWLFWTVVRRAVEEIGPVSPPAGV